MARPVRQGVDYFPLDIYLDDKFKFIEIKFGLKGFAIIVKLLQKIYSYGYWYAWGEDEKLIFGHDNKIEIDLLNQITEESLKRDIFDKTMYNDYGILTSTGIQKRYQQIVKRRKDVEVIKEYLLIEGDFGESSIIINTDCIHDVDMVHTECMHDVSKSTQSKVKESKVNKSKVNNNNNRDDDVVDSVETVDNFLKDKLTECGFNVSKNILKLLNEFINEYSKEWVIEAIEVSDKQDIRKLSYVKAILKNWKKKGKNSKALTKDKDFEEREYDYDELEKKLLGWE